MGRFAQEVQSDNLSNSFFLVAVEQQSYEHEEHRWQ
jgi:hypothetical protein